MKNENKLAGRWGEDLAAEFLKKKGWRIVGRNYSCRMGEIDIIAQKGPYIVFAEVKLRKSARFARAMEYVTEAKQRRIVTAAELWLQANPTKAQPRFDVIEVYAPEGLRTETPEINHIEDAFET